MKRDNVDVELTSSQSGTRLMQVLDCQSLGGQVQVRNTSLKSSSLFPQLALGNTYLVAASSHGIVSVWEKVIG